MARIQLCGITKRFGPVTAVNDLSLEIEDGEFFTLLGPPGAGKTTTLRVIVGLETPDTGDVLLDGERVNDIYPGDRDIAMIFQNLALYPDKTVFDNIAYPLRERRLDKQSIRAQVQEVARVLRIEPLLQRKPGQLSGGERQRVAIGRAIVRRPRAYLMDEPLSALDALLRLEMRVELKRLQRDLGQTLVYVTHDQIEAMSMSDRIGVLRQGTLQQVDTPETVYNRPANRFVATVIGNPPTNFIPVRLEGGTLVHPGFRAALARPVELGGAERLEIAIRPENIVVDTGAIAPPGAVRAEVFVIEPLGAEIVVDLDIAGTIVKAVVPAPFAAEVGQPVWAVFEAQAVNLLDSATERFVAYGLTEPLMSFIQNEEAGTMP